MSAYETIITEVNNRAGIIRLNRPNALNALNSKLMKELMEAMRDFDLDANIGAIVITGSEKAFAAGADIKEMAESSAVQMLTRDNIALFDQIRSIKKPVIAAVSGYCLGGGNELALSCDLIIASESARFGQPEINIGVIPGAGGTQRLTRIIGKALAMEIVLNNRTLSAQEALQHGLVNRVVPVERYFEEAVQLANEIANRAPLAIRLAKEAINNAYESFLSESLSKERRDFYFLFNTEDQKEGMASFLEKRTPQWKGK